MSLRLIQAGSARLDPMTPCSETSRSAADRIEADDRRARHTVALLPLVSVALDEVASYSRECSSEGRVRLRRVVPTRGTKPKNTGRRET